MARAVLRTAFLERFTCLGDRCEDTCCRGWNMQLDAPTFRKYESAAPELIDATDTDEAAGLIMRRDPSTDHCIKLEGGLCGVHKKYGTDFLGDACHFYPRITRRLGDHTLMTATLSCPEAARLMLGEHAFVWKETAEDRLPHSLKEYLPAPLDAKKALGIHRAFLEAAADATATPERVMMRLFSTASSLERIDVATWPDAAPFYLKSADGRLSASQPQPSDAFHLLQTLLALQKASGKTPGERLKKTVDDMTDALKVEVDEKTFLVQLTPESPGALEHAERRWRSEWGVPYRPVLQRWIQAQLSMMLFPFAGFGHTLEARGVLLALRFAMTRLALVCAVAVRGEALPENETVRVIQSLSRLLDHLGDPELSLTICRDAGWSREGRLRALVGDMAS